MWRRNASVARFWAGVPFSDEAPPAAARSASRARRTLRVMPSGRAEPAASSLVRIAAVAAEIRKVGVVGLGAMGAGIAQLCLEAGVETVGREVTQELGERARDRIGHFLTRKVEKGRLEQADRDAAAARLTLTTDLADLADCDLLIEAIVEELEPKRELFAE